MYARLDRRSARFCRGTGRGPLVPRPPELWALGLRRLRHSAGTGGSRARPGARTWPSCNPPRARRPAGENDPIPPSTASHPCEHFFKGDLPPFTARVSLPKELSMDAVLAVPETDDALAIGGPPRSVEPAEVEGLTKVIWDTLPVSFHTQSLLKQANRYGQVAGHDAVELYLGLATFNEPGTSPTIRSSRSNACSSMDSPRRDAGVGADVGGGRTRGFGSPGTRAGQLVPKRQREDARVPIPHEGSLWGTVRPNVGFEGVWWVAETLQPGTPRAFEVFLYLYH